MLIVKSSLLSSINKIGHGFSTKVGLDRKAPYYFNTSENVGDCFENVLENRTAFLNTIGISGNSVAWQEQIHGDTIRIVEAPGKQGQSDAMITSAKGIALAVSSADCAAVLIYDSGNDVIAAVHSGWKGTELRITFKTLDKLKSDFGSSPEKLYAFVAPCISGQNYEIGEEVACRFNEKYLFQNNGNIYLDIKKANYDMMLEAGLSENKIEISTLCSFSNHQFLHSYRRDGKKSGRAWGVI